MRSDGVLVVGVTGLIGSAVASQLAAAGRRVVGVARNARGSVEGEPPTTAGGVTLAQGDVRDRQFLRDCLGDVGHVVFAAGKSGVLDSFTAPERTIAESIEGLTAVLMESNRGTHVVVLSTQLVYGSHTETARTISDRTSPESPYAISRVAMEDLLRVVGRARGVSGTVLRFGNVFGPVGTLHAPRSHGFVAKMLTDLALKGRAQVYGDGSQCVDLLHVTDAADAISRVLQAAVQGHRIFNVTGERVTVRDVAEGLCRGLHRGTLEFIEWPSAHHSAMARGVWMDDGAFRSMYQWRPRRLARLEIEALGAEWRLEGAPTSDPQAHPDTSRPQQAP